MTNRQTVMLYKKINIAAIPHDLAVAIQMCLSMWTKAGVWFVLWG